MIIDNHITAFLIKVNSHTDMRFLCQTTGCRTTDICPSSTRIAYMPNGNKTISFWYRSCLLKNTASLPVTGLKIINISWQMKHCFHWSHIYDSTINDGTFLCNFFLVKKYILIMFYLAVAVSLLMAELTWSVVDFYSSVTEWNPTGLGLAKHIRNFD